MRNIQPQFTELDKLGCIPYYFQSIIIFGLNIASNHMPKQKKTISKRVHMYLCTSVHRTKVIIPIPMYSTYMRAYYSLY